MDPGLCFDVAECGEKGKVGAVERGGGLGIWQRQKGSGGRKGGAN